MAIESAKSKLYAFLARSSFPKLSISPVSTLIPLLAVYLASFDSRDASTVKKKKRKGSAPLRPPDIFTIISRSEKVYSVCHSYSFLFIFLLSCLVLTREYSLLAGASLRATLATHSTVTVLL